MKLHSRYPLATQADRKRLIDFLSITIEGRCGGFQPYKPNENDDTFWTLDSGNDWKVKFFPDEPSCFELRYRYQCAANPYEEVLAAWLKVRIGVSECA